MCDLNVLVTSAFIFIGVYYLEESFTGLWTHTHTTIYELEMIWNRFCRSSQVRGHKFHNMELWAIIKKKLFDQNHDSFCHTNTHRQTHTLTYT